MIDQKQKVVKTRKEHMCAECRKTIPAGTEALRVHSFVIRDSEAPNQWHEDYYCQTCYIGEDAE